jgi:hypothetical protein
MSHIFNFPFKSKTLLEAGWIGGKKLSEARDPQLVSKIKFFKKAIITFWLVRK